MMNKKRSRKYAYYIAVITWIIGYTLGIRTYFNIYLVDISVNIFLLIISASFFRFLIDSIHIYCISKFLSNTYSRLNKYKNIEIIEAYILLIERTGFDKNYYMSEKFSLELEDIIIKEVRQ